jgi:beta-glucosidase
MPAMNTSPRPYQDAALPIDVRVDDLMRRMDLEDKIGLLFHTHGFVGDPMAANAFTDQPSIASMIADRRMNHFNVLGAATSGREFAQWHNTIQAFAREQPLAIPVTFSSDPRHGFTDNPLTAALAGPFSQWPEAIGLAAVGSAELVEEFADIARQEYLSVGIRVALHPQVDLATEPRWARVQGTFGEDVETVCRLTTAYIHGFQGHSGVGPRSVATMMKHFPGGGPQKDGEDPHFSYGREQVYPGGMFELHLRPFIAAIEAGGSQLMPYYGMPVGTDYEEVGFGFSRRVITELLRDHLGFDGIVCTDWGLLTDGTFLGEPFPARAWGVEHLDVPDRLSMVIDAGCDQIGGEICTDVLVALVREGRVSEPRLDVSARRVLREKFALGLFEDPFLDEERAESTLGSPQFRAAGMAAQRRSVTLLTNTGDQGDVLPLGEGLRVYSEGLDLTVLEAHGTPEAEPARADVAILRVAAPYEVRERGFERVFHAGSLEFTEEQVAHIEGVCRQVPTVLVIYLDRPAVLGTLATAPAALVATFGVSDQALVDVLFGLDQPMGRLPFDVPSSMDAVTASRPDVPFDTAAPAFRCGHGLRYA